MSGAPYSSDLEISERFWNLFKNICDVYLPNSNSHDADGRNRGINATRRDNTHDSRSQSAFDIFRRVGAKIKSIDYKGDMINVTLSCEEEANIQYSEVDTTATIENIERRENEYQETSSINNYSDATESSCPQNVNRSPTGCESIENNTQEDSSKLCQNYGCSVISSNVASSHIYSPIKEEEDSLELCHNYGCSVISPIKEEYSEQGDSDMGEHMSNDSANVIKEEHDVLCSEASVGEVGDTDVDKQSTGDAGFDSNVNEADTVCSENIYPTPHKYNTVNDCVPTLSSTNGLYAQGIKVTEIKNIEGNAYSSGKSKAKAWSSVGRKQPSYGSYLVRREYQRKIIDIQVERRAPSTRIRKPKKCGCCEDLLREREERSGRKHCEKKRVNTLLMSDEIE